MTGYSSEEIIGKNPRIFQGPKSDRAALNLMTEAIKSWEPHELTTINYKKNGEEFWLTFSISPVSNDKGEYTHWISIERDVTEMIRANEEIANQKKFTEDILNNIPTDIAVFDPNHNYLFINPYGIKNKEIREWMINKNDFDYTNMKGIDDALARRRWDIFEEAVETKNTVEWIDEHKTIDGKTNFILRHFYPYFERNRLKFVIGYGIDITSRKLIEIKLNEAIESIKKTNTELEQFAYVASHDLQEPLRMVTSFLSQLEKKYSDKLDDKAKEYIFYAVDGAKRMRQIILDLLEFSRAGKSEDKIKDIDINEIVKEIQFLHHKQIEELKAIITTDNLPIIKGYLTPLRQIFQNLIGNSLKYHRKGIPPEIKITAVESENAWEFSIIDNGIGIESQYFEKIFIIFQRLHNKEDYAGTGIGLALTKKIIENMGGSIWVDSSENIGSSFHFTIPFKQNKTDIDQ
jgi:PAS domain S-box-containing protein